MITRLALAAWLVLVATPAHAFFFLWGQEQCQVDTASDELTGMPWQGSSTNADVYVTNSTTVFGDATNRCSLSFAPQSGNDAFYTRTDDFSGETTLCRCGWLYVSSIPTIRRKIDSFEDGSGNDTAFLTIEPGTTAGKVTIQTWYESTGNECLTSDNNGAECTSVSECGDAGNPGEAQCSSSDFGTFANVDPDTWYTICYEQSNGTGEVSVELFAGEPGAVYSRGGGGVRPQEVCSSTYNGYTYACATNADCPAGTCSTTQVKTTNLWNLGTDDTVAAAAGYLWDNVFVTDQACSAALVNYWVAASFPSSDGATTDWTSNNCGSNHYDCINDAATPAVTESDYLSSSANSTATEIQGLTDYTETDTCTASGNTRCNQSNISCASNADCTSSTPTIPVVAMSSDLSDQGGGTSGNKTVTSYLKNSASLTSGVAYDLGAHASNTHMLSAYHASTTAPGGGAWSATILDSMEIRNDYVDAGAEGSVRNSATTVEAMIELPEPPVPTVLPDNDGDGDDTVAFVGNSRFNVVLDGGFFDDLIEPDNICDSVYGGRTIGDALEEKSCIESGCSTGFMACAPRKGESGHIPDVFVVMLGINTLRGNGDTSPEVSIACDNNADCTDSGVCNYLGSCGGGGFCSGTLLGCETNVDCGYCTGGQAGYCFDDGGPDEGNPCTCKQNSRWRSDTSDPEVVRYCVNPGDFGTECLQNPDCACANNSDCYGRTTCNGSNYCTSGSGGAAECLVNNSNPTTICHAGCLNAEGCSSGVCVAGNSMARVQQGYRELVESFASTNADVVMVMSPRTAEQTDPWAQVKTGCWQWYDRQMGQLASWEKKFAGEDADYHYVDAWSYLSYCCPDGKIANCLKTADGIHPNETGAQCIKEVVSACLTNESGTSDGVCDSVTTNRCTQGKVSYPCTNNADCSFYDCAF